jgi:CubicO group peptidase (beta-lactamase class C family)
MAQKSGSACTKVSLSLLFLLLFQFCKAQYNFSETDTLLKQNQKTLGNNIVTLVYKDGKMIYTKEQGDFKTNTPAPIASCSKWLTAALVMTFVDEGKLSLDDKVSTYLPIFASYSKGYITIRQCLSHMTGIAGGELTLMNILKMSKYKTLEDEVNDFASKHDIQTNPGTEFRYSTIGLNIAGRILEVITKKPFEYLMQQRILKPLGMKNTTFQPDFDKAANPSGSAVSTAADYMRFMTMILNKGMYNGKRILSENAIAEMQKSQTTLSLIKYAPKAAEGYNYGLGEWVIETDNNGNTSSVSSPGLFGTFPYVDIKRNYAAIVFVKTLLSEQRKDICISIKESIDKALGE